MTAVMKDDYGFPEALFTVAPSNNIDAGLLPTMKTTPVNPNPAYSTLGAINIQLSPNVGMPGCNATWESLVLQFPSAGLWFPAALMPYITAPECRLLAGYPTDGYWGINEKGFYQGRSGTVGVRGFVTLRSGLAAPAWAASTNFAVNSFVVASPDNLHVFMNGAACTSGSSQPSWNTASGGTTTDNTCTWTEEGQSAAFAPLGPALDTAGDATFAGTMAWGGGATIASSSGVALANQLPLSGSVAGPTTPLAANSCGDTITTTITGATTSMAVVVQDPAAFPVTAGGLIVTAGISSANTIAIGYCNITGSSITPLAATIQIRVVQ